MSFFNELEVANKNVRQFINYKVQDIKAQYEFMLNEHKKVNVTLQ